MEGTAGGIKGEVQAREPSRYERAVVRRSAESRATVPDLELAVEARAEGALALAAELGGSLTPLLVRACAVALRAHPRANGAYRDGRLEEYGRVNVGVVVAAEDTYVIPTVFDADRRPARELAHEVTELEQRAASGELSSPELSGATFTLWNAGALGLTSAVLPPVPPQAAVLTAGAPRAGAVIDGGAIVAGHVMTLSLACDHRILFGAYAASFLGRVRQELEEAAL